MPLIQEALQVRLKGRRHDEDVAYYAAAARAAGVLGAGGKAAVPGLLRARMSGNESSAIGSLRAVNSAQATGASGLGAGPRRSA